MALIGGVVRNANTNQLLPFVNCCITSTLNCAATDGNGIWNAAWGYEGINVTFTAGGFNQTNANFTSQDIAYYPDYGLNGYWKVVLMTPKPPETTGSCFTGDTEILLANGTERPISRVTVGTQVIGQDGSVNTVIGVETPRLGGRNLHSLNGGQPFVTAEHPFAGEDGWRTPDPLALGAEGATLAVAPLRVGDLLRRVVGVGSVVGSGGQGRVPLTELAVVHELTAHAADPATTVYNLLLDGDHTYVAGGWLVHNKSH